MVKGFIFDLDGTIYLGEKLINGALETYQFLVNAGHKVVFVTNKPISSRQEYTEKLNHFGFDISIEQVINSNYVTALYLQNTLQAGEGVYMIGETALKEELELAGIRVTENEMEAKSVVISWDRQFTYDKLNKAFQAWKNGAEVIATNPDRTCPIEGGEIPDCGAIIGAVEGATGEKVDLIAGKPSELMADLVVNHLLQLPPSSCYMVGDRLETDIQMGLDAGLQTILVLSGVTDAKMAADSTIKPTFTFDSVREIQTL
ncbi:MAG: HAD-IIA family hydrolase [Paenisporosarcina sp.]